MALTGSSESFGPSLNRWGDKMRRAYCSYTAQPNTPETDKLPEVPCIVDVKLDNGSEEQVQIMAAEPQAAISKVNGLNDETYNNLKRVVSHEKSRSN
jgi:hypothetical protein